MIRFHVKPNLASVRGKLNARARKMANFTTAHKKIAIFLDRWNKQNFQSEGGNVGGWKPLKAGGRYVQSVRRPRRFSPSAPLNAPNRRFIKGAKVLQDTGTLKASIHPFHSQRDAGIRSRLSYAPKHEHGLGNVPQRRMMPKYKEVRKNIRAIYRGHIREALR